MKKKLLFVIESLTTAGAERSLISLLSALDYSKYDASLQLFKYGGELERYLPGSVHLLPPLDYTVFAEKPLWEQIKSRDLKKISRRLLYSLFIRIGKTSHADKARKYWKTIGSCLPKRTEKYDVAVAYSQGIPTFYVAERIDAPLKIAWVNVGYVLSKKNNAFQSAFYQRINDVVCVSETAKETFVRQFPSFQAKTSVLRDRIDHNLIRKLAEEYPVGFGKDTPSILTVARFAPQKGYDLALEACRILKERNIRFKWYAIGRGSLQTEIEDFVRKNHLQEHFCLLGTFSNPYPYFKAATLYVQTSRHEGFGLAIAEARVLGIPVVTTEFDAVWQQMVQGKNGLVVPQDPAAIADAIERLLFDNDLRQSIVSYLAQEAFDSEDTPSGFSNLLKDPLS